MGIAKNLQAFAGRIPILSNRLLPEGYAIRALNINLESGEIRPIQLPALVNTFGSTTKQAIRIPDPAAPSTPVWLGGTSQYARFFQSPLVNDSFRRFIWIDGNSPGTAVQPVVNSFARIKAGNAGANAPIQLGVPTPTAAPSVTVTGGSGNQETRSYLYTLYNIFGEEGAPSPAFTVTGFSNATSWDVSGMALPGGVVAATRGITGFRLYRTVTGTNGQTSYYKVADIAPTSTTTYTDSRTNTAVASDGIIIPSTLWAEPLPMEGMTVMPAGFFVGWNQRDLYFSEPYRPWAWPAEYQISSRDPILGVGVNQDIAVVLTTGRPVLMTGYRPEQVALSNLDSAEPCTTPNSIVSSPEGVYFSGFTGLMRVTAGGVENITKDLISQTDWRANYAPANLSMARLNATQLLAFSTVGTGFVLDLSNQRTAITDFAKFDAVDSSIVDPYTGQVWVMSANKVWQWAASGAPNTVCRYESKEFQAPKPVNIGALRVFYDQSYNPSTALITSIITQETNPANDLYLASGIPCRAELWVGGSAGWTKVWANNITASGAPHRAPSGLKSDLWKIVIVSRVPVYGVQFGETLKDLENV